MSSLAVVGSLFWFLLAALWLSQDTNETPLAWGNIAFAFGVLALGSLGLYVTLKKIRTDRKRIREKMRLLDKIEADESA